MSICLNCHRPCPADESVCSLCRDRVPGGTLVLHPDEAPGATQMSPQDAGPKASGRDEAPGGTLVLHPDEAPGATQMLAPDDEAQASTELFHAPVSKANAHGVSEGRVLGSGRFVIRRFLGAGAFGSTWVSEDTRFRRECVVKVLKPASVPPTRSQLDARRRFSNEAMALAHLVHPHITQVFDHGEESDGAAWIAMEYVRGRTLTKLMEQEAPLDTARIARLGAQAASALAFAHRLGVVHRDIKPDNILVERSGSGEETVKILDFGIARISRPDALNLDGNSAAQTQHGLFIGTPAYMSPEQAQAIPVGPASDVYSLGVVLYELTTGSLPGQVPESWSPLSTYAYVVSPFAPVQQKRPDAPWWLAETIGQMLEKKVGERTLDAASAQKTLEAHLHRPRLGKPRMGPWPWVAAVASALVLALLATLVSTRMELSRTRAALERVVNVGTGQAQ